MNKNNTNVKKQGRRNKKNINKNVKKIKNATKYKKKLENQQKSKAEKIKVEMVGVSSKNDDIFSPKIAAYLKNKSIAKFYPWQLECLKLILLSPTTLKKDLIFTAPTGSGKSLIAELAILNAIIRDLDDKKLANFDVERRSGDENEKKAIYILPFISIAREKLMEFQVNFRASDLVAEGFFGSYLSGSFDSCHLAIEYSIDLYERHDTEFRIFGPKLAA
uniref:DEAD/DEAH box helicase domain-containing protein n=1 Tax=Romanomermis culicivorax TaxID=13658 RepID=A0A915KNI5_ROMCU